MSAVDESVSRSADEQRQANTNTGYPYPTSAGVSARMRSNRSQDTGPELRLRSVLHRAGLRYRVNPKIHSDSGRPIRVDIAFTRLKIAVFMDGCFWHGCGEHRSIPVSNRDYWEPKIARNAQRDEETTERLERAGWTVIRVWEHEDIEAASEKIATVVRNALADDPSREASGAAG